MGRTGIRHRRASLAGAVAAVMALAVTAGCAGSGAGAAPPPGDSATSRAPSRTTPTGTAVDPAVTTCPPTSRLPAKTSLPGASSRLVPFSPTSALLCLYAKHYDDEGTTPRRTGLVVDRSVDATTARQIAAHLDALPRSSATTGPVSCPMDWGTVLDVYFRDGARQIETAVTTTGCPTADNGTTSSWAGNLDTYLKAVVPFPAGVR